MSEKGDGHIGRHLYLRATSIYEDSVGDVRIYGEAGLLKAQGCTVANPVKGGGTWVDVDIGSGGSLWELDGADHIKPLLSKLVKNEHIALTEVYTGNLSGATTQKEANDVLDAFTGGDDNKLAELAFYLTRKNF